ncbi:hypothetical protein SASPL_150851 [Salvia splendens]|uniref:Wall-associated receptor kinase galacturonan-binding domain-containing protein n=1 Tax=Salvia splendens TaxID=180675 RepID=A0A4D8ZTA4_SALSN|nr:hypothetical protein SASPL_150823 [Salvia splendens]KAG6389383.1 hypothetical protein SASPL_150851 [Salvia splendens]
MITTQKLLSFLTTSSLFIFSLIHAAESADANKCSPPSACGLKSNPSHCGHPKLELTCENNSYHITSHSHDILAAIDGSEECFTLTNPPISLVWGSDRDVEGVLAPTAPTGQLDELPEGEASETVEKGGRAKERGRKKMRDVGQRKERPKRNVSQPAKYRDFTRH